MELAPDESTGGVVTDATVAERLGVSTGSGRPLGWWGMVLGVVTEATLFALLLLVWFYLAAQADEWPPVGIPDPELTRSGIRSALLLFSSVTISWAERGIRKGQRNRLLVGLVLTFLLAAVFMAGHVQEMIKLPSEFTWATNAYGSARYTILNFHAAHLGVGMAMLLFALFAGLRGRYGSEHHLDLSIVSIYWHFVDVIWIFVYSALYLAPHLLNLGVGA